MSLPDSIVARLPAVADAWVGTPYQENLALRGVGASCHWLVGAIYAEAGWEHAVIIPEVPSRWSGRIDHSPAAEFLDAHPLFTRLSAADVQPGDTVGFYVGRFIGHLGLVVEPGRFVHALRHCGVRVHSLHDMTYRKRLATCWRPLVSDE